MSGQKMRAVVAGLVVSAAAITTAGCADNRSSLFIRQVQAPDEADDGTCSYTADPGVEALAVGVMDLMFTTQYRAGLLVGNQLVTRGSTEKSAAETARVELRGAEVNIETGTGEVIRSYTVEASGFADASQGGTPGWGVVQAVLVDTAAAEQIRSKLAGGGVRSKGIARLVSVVKVFGRSLGGQDLESGEFRFPVEVCYGCLVTFPLEANDKTLGAPNCKGGAEAEQPKTSCQVGQDGPVDCRVCKVYVGSSNEALCEPL